MRPVFSMMGPVRSNTVRIQLSDTSQLLSAVVETALSAAIEWGGIVAAMITCEAYDCRIAFGVNASTTVGHILYVGQAVRIPSTDMVSAARLINKTALENAIIQVTLEY